MGNGRITLQDIAERAEVSVTTVSLVLNDKASAGTVRISEQTIRKVRRTAVEMGYLSRGIVGLIVPQIDSYFGPMISGIMGALRARAYGSAMGLVTHWQYDHMLEEIDAMQRRGYDCLILASPYYRGEREPPHEYLRDVDRVVMVNWSSSSTIPHVTIDHQACGYVAAKHLIELGHRRIAFVGEHYPSEQHRAGVPIIDARFDGYLEAMQESRLPWSSVELAEELFDLPDPVTAAYCGRTLWASHLLNACWDRGVRVPDDLAIVRQDDMQDWQLVHPTLTAVDVRPGEVGSLAAEMALDLIDGKQPESVILEPSMVVRESTAAPKERLRALAPA